MYGGNAYRVPTLGTKGAEMSSKTTNLYMIFHRRPKGIAFIVAARGSEDALQLINHPDWALATTITRRVIKNILEECGVLRTIKIHAETRMMRVTGRSREAAERRRDLKL